MLVFFPILLLRLPGLISMRPRAIHICQYIPLFIRHDEIRVEDNSYAAKGGLLRNLAQSYAAQVLTSVIHVFDTLIPSKLAISSFRGTR